MCVLGALQLTTAGMQFAPLLLLGLTATTATSVHHLGSTIFTRLDTTRDTLGFDACMSHTTQSDPEHCAAHTRRSAAGRAHQEIIKSCSATLKLLKNARRKRRGA